MTDLLEFIIAVFLVLVIFRTVYLLYRRTALILKLRALGKKDGIEVSLSARPYLSLLRLSRAPEFRVNIRNTVYLVRTYNGGGTGKCVHFASEKFTVRFSKMTTAMYRAGRRGGKLIITRGGFAVGTRVKLIPKLGARSSGKDTGKTVPVLIFNPAPGEVSYVTKEKNSIKVAFTGDEIYGMKIFNLNSFLRFADREARRAEPERSREEFYEFVN